MCFFSSDVEHFSHRRRSEPSALLLAAAGAGSARAHDASGEKAFLLREFE